MDKKWMFAKKSSKEYMDGVDAFLEFCKTNCPNPKSIKCPCLECGNTRSMGVWRIYDHLICNGIDKSYQNWVDHGEPKLNEELTEKDNLENAGSMPYDYGYEFDNQRFDDGKDEILESPNEFEEILEDAEKPIYPGCTKFTKLSTLVRLFNLKARHGVSNKFFSDMLDFLRELLPENNEIPESFYEAKNTLNKLGMDYEKIHACPNDCTLYRNELKDSVVCPVCKVSRWKKQHNNDEVMDGIPAKVLWYIPIIPCLVRLFRNPNHAKRLIWHDSERIEDGKLRHPADAPAWKTFDRLWPEFAAEPRNLRFGLSTDIINPHSSLSSRYSCWPVIIVIYNLSPRLCMKRKFMLLSMLISGPKQPGNDIDVYLAPLVDDLKILWKEGVRVHDGFRGDDFTLKAALMWTISDFPAYGNLSGCSVKEYLGCPICQENTRSQRLKHGGKIIYNGHRRFLPRTHHFRRLRKAFNGEQEFGMTSPPLSGVEIEKKASKMTFKQFGKIPKLKRSGVVKSTKRKRSEVEKIASKGQGSVDASEPCCLKKKIDFLSTRVLEVFTDTS